MTLTPNPSPSPSPNPSPSPSPNPNQSSLADYTETIRLDTGEDRFLHDCANKGEWDTFTDAAKMGSILTDEQCWPTYTKGF